MNYHELIIINISVSTIWTQGWTRCFFACYL